MEISVVGYSEHIKVVFKRSYPAPALTSQKPNIYFKAKYGREKLFRIVQKSTFILIKKNTKICFTKTAPTGLMCPLHGLFKNHIKIHVQQKLKF